jgi:hypothetical protein
MAFDDTPIRDSALQNTLTNKFMEWAMAKAGIQATPKTIFYTILISLSPFILIALFALSQRDTPSPPPIGCRKLGVKGRGNFEDQYSKKYAKGGDATKEKPWTVKALFIYPLKSAAPVELDKSEVLRTGLKYDRQFTLGQYVTSMPGLDGKVTSEWQFCTQRKFPRLAKVETEIWVPDPSAPGYKEDGEWVKSEGCLVIRFPFSQDTDFSLQGLKSWGKILAAHMAGKSEPMLEFRVPFNPSRERIKSKGYKSETLRIWKDSPVALNMASEVDPELLAKLKYTIGTTNPIALFRIDTNKFREVYKCAPKKEDVGFQTAIGMQDSVSLAKRNTKQIQLTILLVSRTHLEPRFCSRCRQQITQEHGRHQHYVENANCQRPPLQSQHLLHRSASIPRGQLDQSEDRRDKLPHLVPHHTLQAAERGPRDRQS